MQLYAVYILFYMFWMPFTPIIRST